MLIGREKEVQELRQAYDSDESKFVAVFGRRRIADEIASMSKKESYVW